MTEFCGDTEPRAGRDTATSDLTIVPPYSRNLMFHGSPLSVVMDALDCAPNLKTKFVTEQRACAASNAGNSMKAPNASANGTSQ